MKLNEPYALYELLHKVHKSLNVMNFMNVMIFSVACAKLYELYVPVYCSATSARHSASTNNHQLLQRRSKYHEVHEQKYTVFNSARFLWPDSSIAFLH